MAAVTAVFCPDPACPAAQPSAQLRAWPQENRSLLRTLDCCREAMMLLDTTAPGWLILYANEACCAFARAPCQRLPLPEIALDNVLPCHHTSS